MSKFIEMTDYDENTKTLINTDYIMAVIANGDKARISFILGDKLDFGDTVESYDEVKAMLMGDTPAINGWISVKDRLPDKSGEYLTYNAETCRRYIYEYSQIHKMFNSSDTLDKTTAMDVSIKEITHWMPLPECPIEE